MRRSSLHHVIPILDVRDVDAALRYYTERLGFQVAFRYAADPGNYAGVVRDSAHLHMQWQAEEEFVSGKAGGLRVRILVDDPDALFEEYRASGAIDATIRIRDTDWGTREFAFRDPDGNTLAFFRAL